MRTEQFLITRIVDESQAVSAPERMHTQLASHRSTIGYAATGECVSMSSRGRGAAASDRARWLAELAAAIARAQDLAWRLGYAEGESAEARDLYRQLEAARLELGSLRRGGWDRSPVDVCPKWMKLPDEGNDNARDNG